jgi:hypothetical protein
MNISEKRPIQGSRSMTGKRGLTRFEVLGLDSDRELIRSLARRLAENGPDASEMRAALREAETEPTAKGTILYALRDSPLVGAGLDFTRSREAGRKVKL